VKMKDGRRPFICERVEGWYLAVGVTAAARYFREDVSEADSDDLEIDWLHQLLRSDGTRVFLSLLVILKPGVAVSARRPIGRLLHVVYMEVESQCSHVVDRIAASRALAGNLVF